MHVHRITPAVSVLVVTYQHAPFIAECLDGILAQQTDFPFEVDHRRGRERRRHPGDLHRLRRRPPGPDPPVPAGPAPSPSFPLDPDGVVPVKRLNGRFTRLAARADVLAFCEGDDCWTDPTKLQRQYDVLQDDPRVAVGDPPGTVDVDDRRGGPAVAVPRRRTARA